MNTIILSIKKKIRLLLFILNYFIESLYIFYIESLGHPYSSKPFLSGDSFRSISKNIYESKRKNIQKVSSQSSIETIFIESHLANELNDKPLEFNEECILILHNSDDSLKEDSILLINPKIKKIFAQNINFYHPKVTPIPIGLENAHLRSQGIIRSLIFAINMPMNNKPAIFYQFNVKTNVSVRSIALDYISKHPLSETTRRLKSLKYLLKLKNYMFCLAPEGNGVDTHRVWECIYLNVIPICKENYLTLYFRSLGLPIWVVNDWTDLEQYKTLESLEQKYHQIMSKSNTEAAYWNYWHQQIVNYNSGRTN